MPRESLEGGSYVLQPADIPWENHGPWRSAALIDRARGAKDLTLHAAAVDGDASPWLRCAGSETVLFATRGAGALLVGDREFRLEPECGAFVAPGETFRLTKTGDAPLEVVLAVCPPADKPLEPAESAGRFDENHETRVVSASARQRQATGDRFYQLLIDERVGCENITQFIGAIPRSRAPEHYHAYEEAIVILAGTGVMHAGDKSAPVAPGSVIYLPTGQRHSLEATTDDGLKLVGMFYPSGSPAVSYD